MFSPRNGKLILLPRLHYCSNRRDRDKDYSGVPKGQQREKVKHEGVIRVEEVDEGRAEGLFRLTGTTLH